ncbi:MAG: transposase [Bacteroidota bacterium]|nr:transposase [Bacteroidota bacterium]
MYLNEIGKIADKFWADIPNHFLNVELGEFVIMPNHVHGIIIINESTVIVETRHASSLPTQSKPQTETGHALSLPNKSHSRLRNQGKNTISAMVGSFKSAVTKSAHAIELNFRWQPRFYDHIIRSHENYKRISNYIINNPANWNNDKFYNPPS